MKRDTLYFQAEDIFQLRGDPCDHWNGAVAKYGHGLVELSKGDLSKSMRLLPRE